MNIHTKPRHRSLSLGALCTAAAFTLLGCPEDPPPLPPASLLPPVALQTQLALVDRTNERVVLLGVGPSNRDQRVSVGLPHGTAQAYRRNGVEEVLVLGRGRRAERDKAAEPAVLSAVNASGQLRKFTLGNPFDTLIQSEDGRYALLFKVGNSMRLLDNPNEIAIVDLEQQPDAPGAVTLRTLRSFGDSPSSVVFSPRMNIAGLERRLAVVLSATNVTLIDLDHLTRRETTVQLSSSNGQAVTPTAVSFDAGQAELYVRANSNDLFVFNLRERRDTDAPSADGEEHNDFRPYIDQLGIGGQPTDLAMYSQDGARRLLVVAPTTSRAFAVDPSTSQVTSIGLPSAAGRILLFEGGSPRDREKSTRALLYQQGGNVVQFLDLDGVEARGARNLEQLTLEQPIGDLLPMLDEGQVMVLHRGNGVSLIDLAARTVTLITSTAMLSEARLDPLARTLWFGPSAQPFVGLLDLKTGATSEVLLDANVSQFVPVFGARRVAVLHAGQEGAVSLIDADKPTRENTVSLRGFLE